MGRRAHSTHPRLPGFGITILKLSESVNVHQWDSLTWNFSVAAFFSSVEALKSLSGCVLGLCMSAKLQYERMKFQAQLQGFPPVCLSDVLCRGILWDVEDGIIIRKTGHWMER